MSEITHCPYCGDKLFDTPEELSCRVYCTDCGSYNIITDRTTNTKSE